MRRSYRLLTLLSLCLALPAWAEVGHIEIAHGDITLLKMDGTNSKASSGAAIDKGDTLVSNTGAWAVLQMVDGASLSLRPSTKLRIDDYRFDEDNPSNCNIALNLFKGALRSITGLIGKQNPQSYRLATPTATIGIRGTDHETVVIDEESATHAMEPGTYDSVNAGETVLHGAKGDIAIQPGKVGFLHRNGLAGPNMLAARPKFFERIKVFEQRQGIEKVLGRLHAPLGNGAFGAHPDLKERLQKLREQRRAVAADKPATEDRPAKHWREKRRAQAEATDTSNANTRPATKPHWGEHLHKRPRKGLEKP